MPRLLSKFASTPEAKVRLHRFSLVAFAFLAALGWWTVATEGSTPARLLGAIAATVAVGVEIFVPKRRRLLRRGQAEQEDS